MSESHLSVSAIELASKNAARTARSDVLSGAKVAMNDGRSGTVVAKPLKRNSSTYALLTRSGGRTARARGQHDRLPAVNCLRTIRLQGLHRGANAGQRNHSVE